MQFTSNILSRLTRQTRWSEGHVFAITPEQIGVMEGIRASLAVAIMLVADLQWHIPALAFGAVTAFWACLCDPGGNDRTRAKVMGGFGLATTVAMPLAAWCAHWGPVAGGTGLFVLILLCGLTRSYQPSFGPMPAPPGLIVAIAVVVGAATPSSADAALAMAAAALGGTLLALLLCIVVWRIHPRQPARRALVAVFARLEDMTAKLLELDQAASQGTCDWSDFNVDHRRAVRFSIERAREAVARLPAGRVRFTQGVDAAGRILAALIALGHQRSGSGQAFDPAQDRPLLEGLRALMHEAMHQADRTAPNFAHSAAHRAALFASQAGALLQQARQCQSRSHSVTGHAVAAAAGVLEELARHWTGPEPREPVEPAIEPANQATNPAKAAASAAQAGFNIPAQVWRQALRTAVAVTLSYGLGARFDISFSYWGTIATLVLMQPLGANTWLRVLERAAGSITGGMLAAILIARLDGPWEMLAFIAPLSAAVVAFRLVNYAMFVFFVTPMFVLVSDFIHPASHLILARAINEAIGAGIGLAACLLLWPEKEKDILSGTINAALATNMAFASGVLRAVHNDSGADLNADISTTVDPVRREAGVASARAEIARQRMVLQGQSRKAHLDQVRNILLALRTVCGATNIVAISRQFGSAGGKDRNDAARAERYDALTRLLQAELAGSDQRAALAAFPLQQEDDLDHAVQGLVQAVQDYVAEVRVTV